LGLVLLHWARPIPQLKFPFQYFPNNSKWLSFKNARHYFPSVQKIPNFTWW
jgi:hypothetical protein